MCSLIELPTGTTSAADFIRADEWVAVHGIDCAADNDSSALDK